MNATHERQVFEHVGFFEEVMNVHTGNCLGTRLVPEDKDRPCGYHGQREMTLLAPIQIQRGHKTITVQASKQRPLTVRTTYQFLCGRMI